MAADIRLYQDGRLLSFTRADDRDIISAFVSSAVAAGATGIGAGIGYMGPAGLHVGFGPHGVMGGPVMVWGAGGHRINAPDWLTAAVAPNAVQSRIATLQTNLTALGYAPGVIDGVMGTKTQEAILAFLKAGAPAPAVRPARMPGGYDAIHGAGLSDPRITPQASGRTDGVPVGIAAVGAAVSGKGRLQKGSEGEPVRQLQSFLNAQGITDRFGRRLTEDGTFGNRTREALRAYQETHPELRQDAVVGRRTFAAMVADQEAASARAPATGAAAASGLQGYERPPTTSTLDNLLNQVGESRSDRARIQDYYTIDADGQPQKITSSMRGAPAAAAAPAATGVAATSIAHPGQLLTADNLGDGVPAHAMVTASQKEASAVPPGPYGAESIVKAAVAGDPKALATALASVRMQAIMTEGFSAATKAPANIAKYFASVKESAPGAVRAAALQFAAKPELMQAVPPDLQPQLQQTFAGIAPLRTATAPMPILRPATATVPGEAPTAADEAPETAASSQDEEFAAVPSRTANLVAAGVGMAIAAGIATDSTRAIASAWQQNWADFDPYTESGRTPAQFAADANLAAPPTDYTRNVAASWQRNWADFNPYTESGRTPAQFATDAIANDRPQAGQIISDNALAVPHDVPTDPLRLGGGTALGTTGSRDEFDALHSALRAAADVIRGIGGSVRDAIFGPAFASGSSAEPFGSAAISLAHPGQSLVSQGTALLRPGQSFSLPATPIAQPGQSFSLPAQSLPHPGQSMGGSSSAGQPATSLPHPGQSLTATPSSSAARSTGTSLGGTIRTDAAGRVLGGI
jgi:peptidoglycan hydrolase-like protein with peptidoglycan-binding domain